MDYDGFNQHPITSYRSHFHHPALVSGQHQAGFHQLRLGQSGNLPLLV